MYVGGLNRSVWGEGHLWHTQVSVDGVARGLVMRPKPVEPMGS